MNLTLTADEIREYSAEARINLNSLLSQNIVNQVNQAIKENPPQKKEIGNFVRNKLQELLPDFKFDITH